MLIIFDEGGTVLDLSDEIALWLLKKNKNEASSSYITKNFPRRRQIKDKDQLAQILLEGEKKGYWTIGEGRKKGSIKIVMS